MSVLNDDQEAFLRAIGTGSGCGHETCGDVHEMFGIEMATALSIYGVTGDQFAAIVLDLMASLSKLVTAHPTTAAYIGLPDFIHASAGVCAVAFRQYEDTNRG